MKDAAVTLEVCLDSVESAVAARTGGAHRIELCSAMADGGLTPSHGLIRAVRAAVRIPLHVLVRPRTGGFSYSGAELRAMLLDVRASRDLGADGIVVGALAREGVVDAAAMARFVREAGRMSVTFHRAFDDAVRPGEALEALIDLGVDRVLTSGGAGTAFGGRRAIRRLVERSNGRIAVMAGGGVERATVARLIDETGVGEVHAGSAVATARFSGRGTYRARISTVEASKVRSMLRSIRGSS